MPNRSFLSTAAAIASMDDGAVAALFFDTHNYQEPCMDVIATVDLNRFRACGRVTSFLGFESVNYRRVHGRFGGDAGNRKRREQLRGENDIAHRIRERNEKRVVQQAVADGLEEYRASRLLGRSKSSKRRAHLPEKALAPNQVRATRTGHVVEVIRLKKRAYVVPTAAERSMSRTSLSNEQVRAKLGLPVRSSVEAVAC